ncbi:hypothetical protein FOA43_003915 [Brettanomyces nanus]|uniref:Uncharacterized protein n=1 Tax=Eeniella nana TaxID=13502 RepID=A0A875S5E5_EENNA|nr:uncharacterized protein FOA43_003915 [Brettanomyces nanus]QPG76526.1 hypothetical protein FOA43_003915 [Brettanomyces nanus]
MQTMSSKLFVNQLRLLHIGSKRQMSDTGRKKFTDKVSEAVQPENDKSGYQKVKESATDAADKLAKNVQKDSDKGVFQKISDTLSGNKK